MDLRDENMGQDGGKSTEEKSHGRDDLDEYQGSGGREGINTEALLSIMPVSASEDQSGLRVPDPRRKDSSHAGVDPPILRAEIK